MTSGVVVHKDNGDEGGGEENLAATRTLGMAAGELGAVAGRQALGSTLCIFGIAFAGFAIALRDEHPESFDLSIFLAIFGFAALITILGVVAAILRKEGKRREGPTLTTIMIAMNSRPVTELAKGLNITNYKVLESLRDAKSVEDLRTRLQAAQGNSGNPDSNLVSLDNRDFLGDLDVIRIVLDRVPLNHSR